MGQEKPVFTLIGPGAIGLNYGGLLARSGVPLRVLGRSDIGALRENGICIEMTDPVTGRVDARIAVAPAQVEAEAAALGAADWLLIAAKATANPELPALLEPMVVRGKTVLFTLQNGMGNAEWLSRHFPDNPVVAGLCFICVNRRAPATVANLMPGRVEIGSLGDRFGAHAREAAEWFTAAGIKAVYSPSLDAVLWRKLCWNVPFNGLAIAAGGITTDRILDDPGLRDRAHRLMREVCAAAVAFGIEIPDTFIEGQFKVTENMGAYRPSSLIDFLAGRAVELEAIWGEPLRRGAGRGIAMPELERLYREIGEALRTV